MRRLLVLCWICIAASEQVGYNYQPLIHHDFVGSGGYSANAIGSFGSGGPAPVRPIENGFSGSSFGAADIAFGAENLAHSENGLGFDAAAVNAPEYNKEFYTYSAPEEEFEDSAASQNFASALKRNLRVVFIRAPENQGLANAALQLAKQASEDRTAIYVLNKQSDIGDLANKLQSIKNNNANKPEVHFVKYRTQEDAIRAQQSIQAQFDSLGGQSHNLNEEIAPVLDFVSPAVASPPAFGGEQNYYQASSLSSSYETPQSSYLPPRLRSH